MKASNIIQYVIECLLWVIALKTQNYKRIVTKIIFYLLFQQAKFFNWHALH